MPTSAAVPHRRGGSRTYLPGEGDQSELSDFADVLRELERGFDSGAALVGPDGRHLPIPEEIFEVLEQVATALARGQGVTVAPLESQLTTQEAADYLGISRPTLVRLLEGGSIAYQLRGRHRRVRLRDLVDYQDRMRVERRAALDEIAVSGQTAGRHHFERDGTH